MKKRNIVVKKDWKGNSDSVRSRLAINKDHTTKGRETDDFYATDPKALELFVNGCSPQTKYYFNQCVFDGHDRYYIWEPAAGVGNLSNWLKENGYNVIASDLKFRGAKGIIEGLDFLQIVPYNTFKGGAAHPLIILTNPPYSLATEFIERALDILPDGGLYIALMNITYLAGQKRFERVYSKNTLREVYVFGKRIECWRNNDRKEYGGKAMVDFAWYVFQKGFAGNPTLYWI